MLRARVHVRIQGMAEVAVIIPFGNGTPARRSALHHVRRWYFENMHDARILIGKGEDPWCKASAVANALGRLKDERILIIADADSFCPGTIEAVKAVRNGVPWAMPHLKVYRMSEDGTKKIYGGIKPGSLTSSRSSFDQDPYKGFEGGGITVLSRETYINCPLDPGFVGWGQEDEAWAMALNGLYGAPWRGVAPLYHLWHEKPPRMDRYAGSPSSVARLDAYKEARFHDDWDLVLGGAREAVHAAIFSRKIAA